MRRRTGTCRGRLAVLAAGAALLFATEGGRAATFGVAGTTSCSARDCHGGDEPLPTESPRRREYTVWNHTDPHARAYQALFDKRATRMVELVPEPGGQPRPAHESPRCLACHTVPALAAPGARVGLRLDGVACEACHGPATAWWDVHTSGGWRSKDPAWKHDRFGMTPLGDPVELARTCAGCHVGAPADPDRGGPDRDVNHDLLAAGHPPLRFELAAYLTNMPAHWRKPRAPTFEARLWLVGQLVTAEAALNLLADRAARDRDTDAAPAKPWPEFAAYDCFACHHDLGGAVPGGGRRDSPIWGRWEFALFPAVEASLAPQLPGDSPLRRFRGGPDPVLGRLEHLMAGLNTDRHQAGPLAREAAALLAPGPELAQAVRLDHEGVIALARQVARDGARSGRDWPSRAQVYLALAALREAEVAGGEPPPLPPDALRRLVRSLRFPPGLNSPGPSADPDEEAWRDLLQPFLR